MLHRGVGVHHAGLLPKYRRVVEELFNRKLLAVVICTETLASGINLRRDRHLGVARQGPDGQAEADRRQQRPANLGRAGRPQFDDRGLCLRDRS